MTPCAWMFRGLPLSLLGGPAGNCHSRSDRNMMNRCRPRSRVASQDSENREERCCQHGKSLSCERRSMLPGHSRLSRLHSIYNLICSSCHRVGQLRRSEGLIFDGLLQASKREAPLVDFGAGIIPPRCQEVHRTDPTHWAANGFATTAVLSGREQWKAVCSQISSLRSRLTSTSQVRLAPFGRQTGRVSRGSSF